MADFVNVMLASFLGSSLVSTLVGFLFLRRNKTLEKQIENQFNQGLKVFESTRTWKEQSLSQLLGPMHMQLLRTQLAFQRWDKKNLHLEGEVVRNGNLAIRDLLLLKGHLIPPELMNHATSLVEHYDYWLEAFENIRTNDQQSNQTDFVFVGPKGYPFPKAAETAFKDKYRELQRELYSV